MKGNNIKAEPAARLAKLRIIGNQEMRWRKMCPSLFLNAIPNPF
jgi:hypothetical protein